MRTFTVAFGWTTMMAALWAQWLWPPQSMLNDASTLNLQVVRQWTETINSQQARVTEIRYNSWEVVDGNLVVIPIEAYYAIPTSVSGRVGAVVMAHGLGGAADGRTAARFALQHGVGALYYSGPGCGQSGGRPFTNRLLFDTIPDPRGSWFWAHAVAGSRAITVLSALPNTDPTRIGMTGYSAGAMATLNVNGFDNRLRMAIPISGTGGLRKSADNGSWIVHLLRASGLGPSSPQFQRLCDTVDPIHQAATQHGATLLINGAQDEFFPIDSTLDTFRAFPTNQPHRLLIIPNWDHGLFTLNLPAPYETFDNSNFANARIAAAVQFWMGRFLTSSVNFPNVPNIPTASLYEYLGQAAMAAELATSYQAVEVHMYFSNDGSWLYGGQRLQDRSGNLWYRLLTNLPWGSVNPTNTVFFSEFRLRNNLFAPNFWVTSVPALPSGFRPRIRPMPNPPRLEGDVDGNGCVDDADLLMVLFAFGATGSNPADVNGDSIVDDADLLTVLFNFGAGC